ncbi:MAG: nucleoside deaminase [Treponema sp.]|nr:nucleoside deaminase [Treponema sp.]
MIVKNIIEELIKNQQIALNSGNPPFAALIVYKDKIIASVSNNSRKSGNPLHHAELLAIQSVIQTHGSEVLINSHLYSTNEPCPMCIGACVWSGIPMVTYFLDQKDVFNIRGWGKFMPAHDIALADDSGIVIKGPVMNEDMLKYHEIFWKTDNNSIKKHSIHIK